MSASSPCCTSHSQASDTLTCAFAGAGLVSFDLSGYCSGLVAVDRSGHVERVIID
ncbi:hypothetical protein BDR05DRAFT_739767 [Suillus weaverae]|nr:hypothetical protein BDR05DRAFT_739767 [Suillus weaverae]